MKITRKVIKTGNSLSVTIPTTIIDLLELKKGNELEFEYREGVITLKKI